jgi:hypothetical protein
MRALVRSWLRGVLVGLVAIALVAFAGFQVMNAGIVEHYSPGWHSESSAEAEREGILVRRVAVVPDSLTAGGTHVRIVDAWVEQVTRVEAPLFVFRRTVRDTATRLVLVGRRTGAPSDSGCFDRLYRAPGEWLGGAGSGQRPLWLDVADPRHDPPFGDTIHLAAERGACDEPAPDRRFAPFDSVTLVAECRHPVTAAEDSTHRASVSRTGSRDGVLVYASPAPRHPCFQLGVVSAALRDTLEYELRRAGVPLRVVTFFRLTAVPEDDVIAGARIGGPQR